MLVKGYAPAKRVSLSNDFSFVAMNSEATGRCLKRQEWGGGAELGLGLSAGVTPRAAHKSLMGLSQVNLKIKLMVSL